MPPKKVIEKKDRAQTLGRGVSVTGSSPFTMWTGTRIDGSTIPSGVYFSLSKLRSALRLLESTGKVMSTETPLSDWQLFNENSESLVATLNLVAEHTKKLSNTVARRRAAFRVRYLSFLETLHSKAPEQTLPSSEQPSQTVALPPPLTSTSGTQPVFGEDLRSSSPLLVKPEPVTPPSGARTIGVPPAPVKLERSGRASRTQIESMLSQHPPGSPGLTDTDLDITRLY